jgi:phospholipid-binding lipoprotein MlaA
MINTTLGVGGLFDFAAMLGHTAHEEDFGQTLGVYGVRNGPYLVLPLLGPSTLRDTAGRVGDYLIDPLNQCCIGADERYVRFGTGALSTREQAIEILDDVRKNSLDPYITVRSAYLQGRAAQVRNGGAPTQEQGYDDIFKEADEGDAPN